MEKFACCRLAVKIVAGNAWYAVAIYAVILQKQLI
jgi:hypothetical protein